MSYDSEKVKFNREHIYVVEVDLDYCENDFSVSPCTATGTGDAKCFNTLASCQDTPNFVKETKTLRFYNGRSPAPIGISDGLDVSAIPCLNSVSISPAEVEVSGGLGVRASVSLSFKDFPHSDIGLDKYVDERTWIALERGSFWTKLRARNPNYENRPLRVLSGYLVDGVFDPVNFQTRYYVVDKLNVSSGMAKMTGKDPLKLAMNKKAQVPIPSNGSLESAITDTDTSLTLDPTGIGSEYPASGKVLIDKEVISYTLVGDVMTLTRAENNTDATAHSEGATVQLCYEQTGVTVNVIVEDMLTNYANIDPAFIDSAAWQSEADSFINSGLSGIIVKPMDVFKALVELGESAPHYLWWDEREQKVQFTALKAPPTSAQTLNMDENIVENSFATMDKPEKRISTVFVSYGQINPTLKLDEPANWEATYARADSDSIAFYDNVDQVKVINSRWITATGAASARRLAALIGRRFANTPREIGFSMDAKDSDVWVGQSRAINHRDIVDFTGEPLDTIFQIIKAHETNLYRYTGLEFLYGQELPEDEGGGDPTVDLIIIDSNQQNINFRTIWDTEYPGSSNVKVKVVLDNSCIIGSSSTATYAIDTGSFPVGVSLQFVINPSCYNVGRGGNGTSSALSNGSDGGPALIMNHDMEIINDGVIGGGGGGGGAFRTNQPLIGVDATGAGGGGAGNTAGSGGTNTIVSGTVISNVEPGNGGLTGGGNNGAIQLEGTGGEPAFANGGDGGNLGQDGETRGSSLGGSAGVAINKNGFTLTETQLGDVRGAILT